MFSGNLLALAGFALVMSISPGPSNVMLLASGMNFGFVRSLPLLFGITCGFLSMVLLVGLGLGEVLAMSPAVYLALKIICAVYVLWLALKIARSGASGNAGDPSMARPIGFIEAALFQLVNPKAWAVALIVTVSYTDPSRYLASLMLLILVFAVVNVPSIGVWSISGQMLKRLLGEGKYVVPFNVAMAVLLVASMVPVFIGT
ncbi:threonine/homoserine/homoserine lactone efflux protein [Ciceribacter lividus]|uniref:Threonine/homoserine/homoserine lactone efflux protein n=1 Tax=Ciceribacter lividus TaxID=1197950 RepID=A0A6I7HI38_9HYPH|nr:LysE family translocator [Ciceribacter lividus]RCW20555.1 threonine/homoserine/homoserine lactone efflux protein [Ciceribacter lividus]